MSRWGNPGGACADATGEIVDQGINNASSDLVLLSAANTEELTGVRAEADRDIAPYRSKMIAAQIEQLHRQYLNKKLLERAKLPRLSLFYM